MNRDYFKEFVETFSTESTLFWVELGTVLVIALVVSYATRRALNRMEKHAHKVKNHWEDACFWSMQIPVQLFIWGLALVVATEIFLEKNKIEFEYIQLGRSLLIIGSLALFGLRFSKRIEKNLTKRAAQQAGKLDATTVSALAKLMRLIVMLFTGLALLKAFGFNITGLLAGAGAGGLIAGFAAKDFLSNFFGVSMIYLDQPFKVGEWIRSPDREIEGEVEEIGWRRTVVRTFDKRVLFVPNSVFSTAIIENPSRMLARQIREVVAVRYQDLGQVQAITDAMNEMLQNHPELDNRQTTFANMIQFGAGTVDIQIYAFTKNIDWVPYQIVKQDVLLKAAQIIQDKGAEIAAPTQTLHLASLPEPMRDGLTHSTGIARNKK